MTRKIPFLIGLFFCLFSINSFSQSQTAIRINSGGFKYTVDTITFMSDRYFTGTFAFQNFSVPDIAGTTYDTLYRSERGPTNNLETFEYAIPVVNGFYSIYLHFAEIYWGVIGGDTSSITSHVGKRVFSVFLEEQEALADFDIYAEVGPATAVVKSFDVNVNDDTLNIRFVPSANRGKVSAIEIIPPGEVPLWVETEDLNLGAAETYDLAQNFPNPFNPSTNIRFSIPEAGHVKLSVFNVIGQTVELLIDEYKDAGTFNVKYTADNLQSGIYFYKIESNNFTKINKMILLK